MLTKRDFFTSNYGSSSEHIVKYGASYYIDGGDRGTVKLFSHGNANNEEVFGSKRSFAVGGAGTTDINLSMPIDPTDPSIDFGDNVSPMNSYWVGAKVITSEPLDQNIEVAYVDVANRRMLVEHTSCEQINLNSTTHSNAFKVFGWYQM